MVKKKCGSDEKPRINLFYESRSATKELLTDYLTLRSENELDIFEMFVTKLKKHLTMECTLSVRLVDDDTSTVL